MATSPSQANRPVLPPPVPGSVGPTVVVGGSVVGGSVVVGPAVAVGSVVGGVTDGVTGVACCA